MANTDTTGQRLRALMERAGLSVRVFAQAAGYSHGSGVQRYIEPDFEGQIKPSVARRFAQALVGKGSPPIDEGEVFALIGIPTGNAIPVHYEGASEQRMHQDIPIIGTALGADRVAGELAIEQTCLYENEQIGFAKRPVVLDGRTDIYGLYVQGSSMDPAYEDGALILIETKRQPRIGEYAVIYLRMNGEDQESDGDGHARTIMVKKLVRKSASFIELEQFTPRMTFRIDAGEVLKMHRVVPWGELLS
ncbi:S24 family peptidase [Novosphingobium sp. MMS21-SN21R]|uniref:S24 family peptidase n=1 Tax=Novosphingobium sp. MMS21-SN21R TaxID=2969298 RepID=UPI002885DB97|nr:S24 family peptidase [Novosphingobium sp. MMS21-SN21R]MDT0507514.1 S24 family peptidase [Novosphingobium sp. MMS21-SN21R]